jgi:hypothetical protein
VREVAGAQTRWLVVAVVAALVAMQVAGRAMRAPATPIGPPLVVDATGHACPRALSTPPAWTRSPAAYFVAMGSPTEGVGYRGVLHLRTLTYGTWRQDGWLFEAVNTSPDETTPLWAAFAAVRLRGFGVVRVTLGPRGVVYTAAWREDGVCRSAIVRATPGALARSLAAASKRPGARL